MRGTTNQGDNMTPGKVGRPVGWRAPNPRKHNVGMRLTDAETEQLDALRQPGESRSAAIRRLSGIGEPDRLTIQRVVSAAVRWFGEGDDKGLREACKAYLDVRG
jgi:hypothetical protein